MNYFGKPYEVTFNEQRHKYQLWSNLCIQILFSKQSHEKKFGYWNMFYDGAFHFFSFYPFRIGWIIDRPIPYNPDNRNFWELLKRRKYETTPD